MQVIFISDANGHEYANPLCTLVTLKEVNTIPITNPMYDLELTQVGVNRRGGSWKELCADMIVKGLISNYTEVKQFRWAEFPREARKSGTILYYLISGNY